jgi:hypothetical protein
MIRSTYWSVLAILLLAANTGYAQVPSGAGQVWTPGSSVEKPGDVGVRAHSNIQIFSPKRRPADARTPSGGGAAGSAPVQLPQAQAPKGTANSAQP